MARRNGYDDPVATRRRQLVVQTVVLAIALVLTLFLVWQAMTAT